MVDPDFVTPGLFEGERKQKKQKQSRASAGSKSGWKAFFRTSSANNVSTVVPESLESTSTTATPAQASAPAGTGITERPTSPAADMLTTSGKDVLWFRGNGKKSVGVS